eukprot:GHVU01021282.1.p2 GENE.GHVU01021282.1~~GHVU01021282.1.p2  ORF type:complete len:120 (-),score=14.28 GHVU01021282.1:341-700(-)
MHIETTYVSTAHAHRNNVRTYRRNWSLMRTASASAQSFTSCGIRLHFSFEISLTCVSLPISIAASSRSAVGCCVVLFVCLFVYNREDSRDVKIVMMMVMAIVMEDNNDDNDHYEDDEDV